MAGDLGTDVAQTTIEATKKVGEIAGKILSFLFSGIFSKDYDKKLTKERYKQIKANREKSFRIGYIKAKEMQKSGLDITYAKYSLNEEQYKNFAKLAKQRGLTFSALENKNDKDKTYIVMYFTKDSARMEDVTEQLIRDNKLEAIDKAMENIAGYKKVEFDKTVDTLGDGRIIDNPVIVCDRNNPYNYIEISSKQEISDEGRPFVNTEYKVFNQGKQQRCDEFKHGKFTHYTDKSGKNTSSYGDEHWENMKAEMKQKSGLSDDLLMFNSKEDYQKYVEQWENNREQTQKDSKFYDEMAEEKENIIREDINSYNDKRAEDVMKDINNEKQPDDIQVPLRFENTVDRFQCNGWEKEEPYFICNRTDPDNYMEINSEKAEFRGEEYTKHTYKIYADDKLIENPAREDKQWTDERFEGRPAGFWKATKEQMKEAGKFSDDMVVFYSKEEMLEYRKVYEKQKENAKESTHSYENDKESFRNNYASVVEKLKAEMKEFEDIGKYENGKFIIETGDNLTHIPNMKDPRCVEAGVISEQINTFEKMNKLSNEIAGTELQIKVNENSELKNSPMYGQIQDGLKQKVVDLKAQMKELEENAEKLSENREKIAGIKAERTVSKKDVVHTSEKESTHGEERITMKQLKKEIEKTQKEQAGKTTTEQIKSTEQHKVKHDKER